MKIEPRKSNLATGVQSADNKNFSNYSKVYAENASTPIKRKNLTRQLDNAIWGRNR